MIGGAIVAGPRRPAQWRAASSRRIASICSRCRSPAQAHHAGHVLRLHRGPLRPGHPGEQVDRLGRRQHIRPERPNPPPAAEPRADSAPGAGRPGSQSRHGACTGPSSWNSTGLLRRAGQPPMTWAASNRGSQSSVWAPGNLVLNPRRQTVRVSTKDPSTVDWARAGKARCVRGPECA